MKSTISTEVGRVGRKNLAEALEKEGVPVNTFNNSIARGSFSKQIAMKLHDLTQIHASFWQSPDYYGTIGERLW